MRERELNAEETAAIYKIVCDNDIEPYNSYRESKCTDLYYNINGKKYRLVYDAQCDWFCDIAYEGDYE